MILVTGGNGQLGRELKSFLKSDEALFVDRSECNISDLEATEALILKNKIKMIINCAAYTLVDLAEKEVEAAYLGNSHGPHNLATLAKKYNLLLVHVSTDYVFDGSSSTPLDETSPVNPTSVYGSSKLEGEKHILEINPRGAIIRTSWLYSKKGKNFLTTILKHGSEKEMLKVVYDQVGTPTLATDLARAIVEVLPKLEKESGMNLFHYSNEGVASWYDFAQAIVELSGLKCRIEAIPSSEYSTPVKRPHFSVLSKSKFKAFSGQSIPYWRTSLANCLKNH